MNKAHALVLGSVWLTSSLAIAGPPPPLKRAFTCDAPLVGSDRCGDKNKNYRVESGKKVSVHLIDSQKVQMVFTVYHAVSDKELVTFEPITGDNTTTKWTNSDKETIDVYFKVKSVGFVNKTHLEGEYTFE